jgi:hypothetical protein
VIEQATHSELGASQYERWKECPGSVRLCRGIEKKSSIYAEEGTKAHEVAAAWLQGKEMFCDPEMSGHLRIYLDHIYELRILKPTFEAVEQRFHLEKLHPKLFGTADYVCYFRNSKTLHVVDLKYGSGVGVDVESEGMGNVQLLYYAVGAVGANDFPIDTVIITIVQPRFNHDSGAVRSHEVKFGDIFEFTEQLVEDALATENPNAPFKLGGHCRWCAAQAICPAKNDQALRAAREAFGGTAVQAIASYNPQKLSATLDLIPQIESWCKGVREFAYQEAESGRTPPGYKLVEKRASRKWPENFEPEQLAFELGLEPDDFFERKIKSIPQIEKLIGKAQKPLLEKFTVRESSGKNLVPESDSRVEIDVIKKAFETIETI